MYCTAYIAPQPIGKIFIVSDEKYLYAITKNKSIHPLGETSISKLASIELDEYFAGKRKRFKTPLFFDGTNFQKKCWKILLQIPYGKTISYKDEAISLAGENYTRAVAGANNKNKIPIMIPCHRVIGTNGKLVGYAWGLSIKKFLLELELKKSDTNRERENWCRYHTREGEYF